MNSAAGPAAIASPEDEVQALELAFPEPITRFEFLYNNLSILDSKASSLMAFNAIGLAAVAIWLENIPRNWLHLVLDLVFVLFLVSSTTCFSVVRVRWFPPAVKDTTHTRALLNVRNRRTFWYRLSWWFSIAAVVVFMLVSVVHMAGTALHAFAAI